MNGYTGPLAVCAMMGRVHRAFDSGEHTVVLTGLGLSHTNPFLVRVRMELTPEDADDLAASLVTMSRIAKEMVR